MVPERPASQPQPLCTAVPEDPRLNKCRGLSHPPVNTHEDRPAGQSTGSQQPLREFATVVLSLGL